MALARIYLVSRLGLAFVWFYHGLVPKLWFGSAQEIAMNERLLPFVEERTALLVSGWMEILMALLLLVLYRNRLLLGVTAAFMMAALAAIGATMPELFALAFNPLSFNVTVLLLAAINWLSWEPARRA